MYVAIDPGKNIGLATFKPSGEDLNKKTVDEDKFFFFLKMLIGATKEEEKNFVTFIMEDYKLRQDKALNQVGSDIPAARIIGAVQFADSILEKQSKIVLQPPSVLYTALKWAGYKRYTSRNSHAPDDVAAYSHGLFYLIKQNIRKHPIDEV